MKAENKCSRSFVSGFVARSKELGHDPEEYLFTYRQETIIEFAEVIEIEEGLIQDLRDFPEIPPFSARRRLVKAIIEKVGR